MSYLATIWRSDSARVSLLSMITLSFKKSSAHMSRSAEALFTINRFHSSKWRLEFVTSFKYILFSRDSNPYWIFPLYSAETLLLQNHASMCHGQMRLHWLSVDSTRQSGEAGVRQEFQPLNDIFTLYCRNFTLAKSSYMRPCTVPCSAEISLTVSRLHLSKEFVM